MRQHRVIILFCLSALMGCSQSQSETVTFLVGGAPHEIKVLERLIQSFEAETGINVNLLRQPTETDQRRQGLLIPLKAGKSDPDVFLMDVAWIAQFAASGWLEPLDPYVKSDDKIRLHSFFDRVIDLADHYQNQLIALPVYIDGGLLYYRKDLLYEFGYHSAPSTWEDLISISKHIQTVRQQQDPLFYGFVWQGAQYEGLICNLLEFIGKPGPEILSPSGQVSLAAPENKKGVQLMYDLIHQYKISPPNTYTEMKEEESRRLFQEGHALFERNWPYAWALHESKDSKVKGKVGIAPLPHFAGGESVSTLGGWHAGISKFSDQKTHAWKLVRFLLSYETQKQFALELGWNPSRIDVYSDSQVLNKMPHFIALREVFEKTTPRPRVPYYSKISEIIQRYVNLILSGGTSVDQGLSQAQHQVESIVDRYHKK